VVFFGIAFLNLQFGFLIFCQKNIGAQAACKMLVKLTQGGRFHQQAITLITREGPISAKRQLSCQCLGRVRTRWFELQEPFYPTVGGPRLGIDL